MRNGQLYDSKFERCKGQWCIKIAEIIWYMWICLKSSDSLITPFPLFSPLQNLQFPSYHDMGRSRDVTAAQVWALCCKKAQTCFLGFRLCENFEYKQPHTCDLISDMSDELRVDIRCDIFIGQHAISRNPEKSDAEEQPLHALIGSPLLEPIFIWSDYLQGSLAATMIVNGTQHGGVSSRCIGS